MGQVFAAFGVDWRLLLINLINFGILLAALWYFLYGPLTKMLASRRDTLAKGIADAEDAAARLAEVQGARTGILADAGKEADAVIAHARSAGAEKQKELVAAGEASAAQRLKDAAREAEELKVQALNESKQEVAKLIVLGMEKVFIKK